MKVVIEGEKVRLEQATDLRRFHASAPAGMPTDTIDSLLRKHRAGHLKISPDPAARINVFWVIANAVLESNNPWQTEFAEMLLYAGQIGWLSSDGSHIHAHKERSGNTRGAQ